MRSAQSRPLAQRQFLYPDVIIGLVLASAAMAALLVYGAVHLSGFSYGQAVYAVNDYDDGVYMATAALMAHGYSLYGQIYNAQPPLLTTVLALSYKVFGTGIAQARATVLVFGAIALCATFALAGQARGWIAAGAAAVVLVLSPEFLVYSRAVEEEVPMMALSGVSLALAVQWLKTSSPSMFGPYRTGSVSTTGEHGIRRASAGLRRPLAPALLIGSSGLFFGLAILTKFFAFSLLAPFVVIAALAAWDRNFLRRRVKTSSTASPENATVRMESNRLAGSPVQGAARLLGDICIFIASSAVPVAISFAVWGGDEWRQMVGDRISASSGQAATLQGESNLRSLFDLVHTDPGLTVLAVTGGVLILFADWRLGLIVDSWALVTVAMLLKYHPLFGHHLIILLVPAAVMAGISLSFLVPSRRSVAFTARIAEGLGTPIVIVAAAGAVVYLGFLPQLVLSYDTLLVRPNGLDTVLASAGTVVRHRTAPNRLVAAGDAWICVDANRLCVPDLVDTSDVRTLTGTLTATQAIHASLPAATVALGRRLCETSGLMAPYVKWVRVHYFLVKRMPLESTGCPTGIYVRR